MGLDLATKDDIAAFEDKIMNLVSGMRDDIQSISEILEANSKVILMDSEQIRDSLGISYAVFLSRKDELCAAGMFKDGQWKMNYKDFKRYIKSKRDN